MQKNIHPTWFHDCQVSCSCGNKFVIGSNQQTMQVDICNKCHPFFTGEVKFVDRQGRVDRFKKKMEAAKSTKATTKTKKTKTQEESKSYRDILRDQQAQLRKAKSTKSAKADKADEPAAKAN